MATIGPQTLPVQIPVAQSPATVHISPFFALHAPAALHVLAPEQVAPVGSFAL
jgi:hypothetical protein